MKRRLSQGKGCLHYEQRELCSRFEYSVQPRVGVEQPEGSDPREYANLNVVELLEEGGKLWKQGISSIELYARARATGSELRLSI